MDRRMVEQYIADYRKNVGRCGYLKVRLRRVEEELEAMRQELADTRRANLNDGTPRGKAPSDPTAAAAALIADGEWPGHIMRVEREREQLLKERAKARAAIDCVDTWLRALPAREEWILRAKVIEGETWERVQRRFLREFGMNYSLSGLKHIRAEAVRRICQMVA